MNIQQLSLCGWRQWGYKSQHYPAKVCSCHKLQLMSRSRTCAENKLQSTSQSSYNLHLCVPAITPMDSMQDLIPFAKELLSQRPSRGLLKVYLVGSVLAVLGTLISLVETVCHPFSCGEPMDSEMVIMLAQEQRTLEVEKRSDMGEEEEEEEEEEKLTRENDAVTQSTIIYKTHKLNQRNIANRLHAS